MKDYIVRLCVYFMMFGFSMYGLSSLNFEKFIRKNKVVQTQILYIIIAMCMAILSGDFLLSLVY